MARLAEGSQEAFTDLVHRHQAVLLNVFRRLGADPHEAEDAVQETFLRLYGYRRRYRPVAPFRVFLFTVARNAWWDLSRRARRWRGNLDAGAPVEAAEAGEGPPVELRMDLQQALEGLSDAHRTVLVLSLYGGLRYPEIAQVLDIPVGTVKSRVFHALRRMRSLLNHEPA